MTQQTAPVPEGWDGLLDSGETILWQGRPDPGFHVTPQMIFMAIFGLFFASFALFWMMLAGRAGGFFWMFGLLHFSVGMFLVAFAVGGEQWLRRRTWYTLTNRRAFIAATLPIRGRVLKSYPILPETPVAFREDTLSSIYFATRRTRSRKNRRSVPVGFERIADGRTVLQMIRQIQQAGSD